MRRPRSNAAMLALVSEGLFSRLSLGLVAFALPLYAHHLGLSLVQIGILTSFNTMVGLALKPLMGGLADRFSHKRSLLAATALRSLVSLLLAFAAAPWHLYAIRSVHGLSMSLRDPSVNALIAEHGGKKSIASAFAWYQTAKSTAGHLSKAFAGVLLTLTAANFSFVFGLAFLLSMFPILVVAPWVTDQPRGAAPDEATPAESQAAVCPAETEPPASNGRRPGLLPFMTLGFLIRMTADMLDRLFPILAVEYWGLTEAETGLIYAIATVAMILGGPGFGWLSDHVSRKLVLSVRGVANTVSSVLYLWTPGLSVSGVAAAKTLDDLGKAAYRPAWGSLMAEVSGYDRQTRARTMGLMSMGEDAGAILAPIAAGFLWSTWGVTVLLVARIGAALLTEAWAIAVIRPRPTAPEATGGAAPPARRQTADPGEAAEEAAPPLAAGRTWD